MEERPDRVSGGVRSGNGSGRQIAAFKVEDGTESELIDFLVALVVALFLSILLSRKR
jgi:hypothetical protein